MADVTPCLSENTLSELLTSGPDAAAVLERSLLHAAECAVCRRLLAAAARSLAESSSEVSHSAAATDAPKTATALLPRGTLVGRYIVLDVVGSGGMGVVYAAYDPDLDRKVALKLLRPQRALEGRVAETGAEALLREAQALARLRHPSVIAVYDVGTCDGQVFIAMELVAGQTAAEWLAKKPRSLEEILTLFTQAGQGLHAAHQANIIHRDNFPRIFRRT